MERRSPSISPSIEDPLEQAAARRERGVCSWGLKTIDLERSLAMSTTSMRCASRSRQHAGPPCARAVPGEGWRRRGAGSKMDGAGATCGWRRGWRSNRARPMRMTCTGYGTPTGRRRFLWHSFALPRGRFLVIDRSSGRRPVVVARIRVMWLQRLHAEGSCMIIRVSTGLECRRVRSFGASRDARASLPR